MSDDLMRTAFAHHQAGNLAEATRLYAEVLREGGANFDALYLLGFAHYQLGSLAEAERLMGQALAVNPHALDALYHRAALLLQMNRAGDALSSCDAALVIHPNAPNIVAARGAALSLLGRHEEALATYDRAVGLKPDYAAAWNHRGSALLELKRNQEALASYDRALSLKPDFHEAWRHRAIALGLMDRFDEALASLERALAIKADNVDSLEEMGSVLMRLNRHAEAVAAYDRVLMLKPEDVHALYNRANALSIVKRYDDAIRDCEKVLAINPEYPYARGVLIHCKLQCCDWNGLEPERRKVERALAAGWRAVSPFNYKALSDSASAQLQCAQVWVRNEVPAAPVALWRGERYRHDRIRLAYVSADFNLSAVATLMARVFERHDRTRFETIAVSFSPENDTAMRQRLYYAFEHFEEMRERSAGEIALWLRRREVDIAVDLMGFTGACRSIIFALRPAPLQVNYLGFAGTMGAEYMDYIVADHTVIPDEDRKYYAEKVVRLPGSYLPNDETRAIAEYTPSRAECGLPDDGFVFASFNNAYKFTPELFDIWMRLLSSVERSVLWLPQHHQTATRNLIREAETRGVAGSRLVFAAPVIDPAQHLARLRAADLFLDTLPYNAHSTAIDALWAGLPLLTCTGHSFAGRVATSLLEALDMRELITDSLPAYEDLALRLARESSTLTALRAKLAQNRASSALFDSARFTRNLEAAFTTMWERHQKGEPPADFTVASAM